MLVLAHSGRFGKLRNELENNYTKGKDEYPETFDKCYTLLYYRVEESKKTPSNKVKKEKDEEDDQDGLIFNTNGGESDLEDDEEGENFVTMKNDSKNNNKKNKDKQRRTTDMAKVQCYNCKEYGHYANDPECPLYKNKEKDEQEEEDTDDLGDDKEGVMEMNIDIHPEDFPALKIKPGSNQRQSLNIWPMISCLIVRQT